MGLGYEWANDPQFADLVTAWSPLIEEKVSFWTALNYGADDLVRLIETIRTFSGRYLCTMYEYRPGGSMGCHL